MFRFLKESFSRYRELKKIPRKDKKDVKYQIIINGAEINAFAKTINGIFEKVNSLVIKNAVSINQGYRFINKHGISTLGFKNKVDIVFCDIHQNVVDFYKGVSPQKITRYVDEARYTFIFLEGFIDHFNLKIKDIFHTKKISQ